jgi:hypothetical protein
MATPKCVALKCDVKDLFDKALKAAVLKQIKQTVQTQVDKNKSKGLSFDDNCKDGWLLTATVLSLKVNDTNKPTAIEAKVFIGGVPLDGSTNGFKANGSAKATSIRANKMEEEAKSIVNDALEDMMTKQVLPQMLKP